MTSVAVPHPSSSPAWAPAVRETVTVLVATAAVTAIIAAVLPDSAAARVVVAVVIAAGLVVVAIRQPTQAVVATIGWLVALGLIRRLVTTVQADPSSDPLLLVAPLVAGVLAVQALRRGAAKEPSLLAIAVAVYWVLTVLAVVNPSLPFHYNAAGWLYYGVPVLWFVIGRGLLDEDGARPAIALLVTAGAAAVLTGVLQVLVGFPPWDRHWIHTRGYAALGAGGVDAIRPFGWQSSSAEYAVLCGLVVVATAAVGGSLVKRRPVVGGALLVMTMGALVGLLVSGVRTSVVLGGLGLVVVIVASRGWRFWWLVVASAVAVTALSVSVRVLDVEHWQTNSVVGLMRRSLVGLSHPFDAGDSTLGHHMELTRDALAHLDDHPLGYGPSAGTQSRPSRAEVPDQPVSAENDLGNTALAFGFPGMIAFCVILVAGLRLAWRAARDRREVSTLVALGVAVVSLRFWTAGAHYGTAAVLWLLLGWLDRWDRPADAMAPSP